MGAEGPGSGAVPRVRIVKCPQCGGPSEYVPGNPWRPFCSERCKLIDLGAWATDSYRIPVEEQDQGLDPQEP